MSRYHPAETETETETRLISGYRAKQSLSHSAHLSRRRAARLPIDHTPRRGCRHAKVNNALSWSPGCSLRHSSSCHRHLLDFITRVDSCNQSCLFTLHRNPSSPSLDLSFGQHPPHLLSPILKSLAVISSLLTPLSPHFSCNADRAPSLSPSLHHRWRLPLLDGPEYPRTRDRQDQACECARSSCRRSVRLVWMGTVRLRCAPVRRARSCWGADQSWRWERCA